MPDMHPAPDISDLRPDLQSRRPAAPPPQRPPVATAWLQTHSGGAFDLLLPTRDAVRLGDIAHSLARIARFLGHTVGGQIWSVADHSLLVADLVRLQPAEHTPSALLLAALLHDAHEAYLGDVIRPVQDLIRARAPRFLDIWADTVFSVQSVIHAAIGLPTVLPASWIDRIHAADRAALAIEHRDVMAPGHDWNEPTSGT